MTPRIKATFRQFRYLVAVGETGSIARAAERISISPPSISAAITELERELNIQLFVRHHARGLTLTPGGRSFFNEVKSLLAHADSLHDTANDISGRVHGPINVGCLVTLSSYIVPELRRRFEVNNPLVSLHHVSANQVDLFEKLRRAEIDIAITYDLETPDGKPLNYVTLNTRLRPLALGLATMKSDKKARVLLAFEEHCRKLITDHAIPGMRARPNK